jgi:RNA polymerase sigma factor (sigma-70 family)
MAETEDLQQLISGCGRNDRASQEKLYKQFYVSLFCLCRRFFPNADDAVEVVNDGMLKVFQKIGSYKEGKGRFFTWVYTIVRNTAIDKLRKEVPVSPIDPVDLQETLIEESEYGNPEKLLDEMDLASLFEELSPASRGIATLFYLEGYKMIEIADALGIPIGTVKWHLSESRKKLKPIFEKYVSQ